MTDWRNRIVGSGEVDPKELVANPLNWRAHPRQQQAALSGVLDGVGWVQNIIVNQRSGRIVDGHLRVSLAMRQKVETVPVVYVDLAPEEEALVLATLDPIAAMATSEKEKLDELLRDVNTDNPALQKLLAEVAQDAGLDYGAQEESDAEPQIDRAAELQAKWQTERGQLWRIGEHRLLCGDSTVRADVERVMGGEKAEMVWTDPPYGVAVGDKNKFLNSIARSNRIEENLENDMLDEAGLVAMLCAAFDNAIAVCTAGAAWYVAAPAGPLHVLFGQVLKDRGIWRQTIQWVKNNATFSPMGVDYHWRAEPIFYGWLPTAGHRYYGGRKQDTVWEIDRPAASPEHPTMKPVELVSRAISNSSQEREVVLDLFLGSGTTLVACQNLGRKGRGIEISPGYVAVTLERMSTAFLDLPVELVTGNL